MKNKSIKILASILILVLGILISKQVKAADFVITTDEYPGQIVNGHYNPNRNNGHLAYCIQPRGTFNQVTMSRTKYDEIMRLETKGEYHCCNDSESSKESEKPLKEKETVMEYSKEEDIDLKEHQDAAYIIADASDKGRLEAYSTQQAIWASSVSKHQKQDNAQSLEAKGFAEFYKSIHNRNGESTFMKQVNENSENQKVINGETKPQVMVDQSSQTYTVGQFNIWYPAGVADVDAPETVDDIDFEIDMDAIIEDLKNEIEIARKAIDDKATKYNNTYNANAANNYRNAYINAKTIWAEYTALANKENIYGKLKEARKQLITTRRALKNNIKSTKYDYIHKDKGTTESIFKSVKRYQDVESTQQDNKKYSINFSYIKFIDVIGLDENGTEIENSNAIYDKQIIQKDGVEFPKVEGYDKVMHPTIKPGEDFYVRFKVHSDYQDKVKSIKLKITFEWLDHCDANMKSYTGQKVEYYYKKDDLPKYCQHWDEIPATCTEVGCTNPSSTHSHTKHGTQHKYWTWKRERNEIGPRQILMLVEKWEGEDKEGVKRWDTGYIYIPNTGIDITMELGGYVFLDKDEGKRNSGDSKLDLDNKTQEVIPGAEVWLYGVDYQNYKNASDKKNAGWQLIGVTTTGNDGNYKFENLNAQKKYYVKFVYNGMLYTNVLYNKDNPEYNTDAWKATSKATENSGERTTFNNKFQEIGSSPSNYKTNSIFDGSEIYNTTYKQEEIVDIFKALTKQIVKDKDVKKACINLANANGNDAEYRRKLQFAVDCRISAYTNGTGTKSKYQYYPIYTTFVTSGNGTSEGHIAKTIGGVDYYYIYPGQKHINLGIKGRPTFDLHLSKDVYNATVSIKTLCSNNPCQYQNTHITEDGKTYDTNATTYKYNYILDRKGYYSKGFPIGIDEDAYLEVMRKKYTNVNVENFDNSNEERNNVKQQTYDLEMRPEEIAEGKQETYTQTTNKAVDGTHNYDAYVESNNDAKLEVKIKYKISITNQSMIKGGPTEIVDYFDNKYDLVELEGNIGRRAVAIKKVDKTTSYKDCKYGENTRFISDKYTTVYLQPYETDGKEIVLEGNETLDIYVTLKLRNASTALIDAGLLQGNELRSINVAEINGYKTVQTEIGEDNNKETVWGLVDKDSTPGNLDIRNVTFDEIGVDSQDTEDDAWRAPAFVYRKRQSKTIEGKVFEDSTPETLTTGAERKGNGIYNTNDGDTCIQGVKVELVNLSTGGRVAETTTDADGWYGFTGFVAGNYKVRFTYGQDDDTAMASDSKIGEKAENDNDDPRHQGKNAKSYNGQDFQSTIHYDNQYSETYWYEKGESATKRLSDATDLQERIDAVKNYSNTRDSVAIVNHKAEVFNSYKNNKYYEEHYPNEYLNIDNKLLGELQYELKDNTYRQAETPTITVEVEQAKTEVDGNKGTDYYTHEISNIDFGIAERPRSELIIDQDVKHIKVTATDGTVLFDATANETNNNNLQWIKGKDYTQEEFRQSWIQMVWGNKQLTKDEKINIIMDDELISGSTIEITYNITVTNTGEEDNGATTRAKNIINYVANNLEFDDTDEKNNQYWQVAKVSDIQKENDNSTWINSRANEQGKYIDLSTQQVTLQSKEWNVTTEKGNPLTKPLKPGESSPTVELKLRKVLAAESASDDLKYTNMTEIVEIENTVGRYDHGAIPGNQDLNKNPTEHDTSGASSETAVGDVKFTPPDGEIVITPPTGSKMIYYAIGITATVILAAGIYLIKKFVIDNK